MPSIGLVIARFYEDLAEAIEEEAISQIRSTDAELGASVSVPGVYDTPLAADRLARRDDIDAVAVLGVVITGDTGHDQVVTHTAVRKLSDVGLNRDKPVTFGILGPATSAAEAQERIEYSVDAVAAAIRMVESIPEI